MGWLLKVWLLKAIGYRVCQMFMGVCAHLIKWKTPIVLKGVGSLMALPALIARDGIRNVLIISDKNIVRLNLLNPLTEKLDEYKIRYSIFSDIEPNPTIKNIEDAYRCFQANGCDANIGVGGGSSMDSAKIVAGLVARPGLSVSDLRGNYKISTGSGKKLPVPPVYAVPTTAGTGSEVNMVAVVTDTVTHEKYTINDMAIFSKCVVLDPQLTLTVHKRMTAATGIDALTHAVEAYTNRFYGNKVTKEKAATAVKMIFENLRQAYADGSDIHVRENMLIASFTAGEAFGIAGVGYCHAIAHSMGGLYNVPHGELNAWILPKLLQWYGSSVTKPLAELADVAGVTQKSFSEEQKAQDFIQSIIKLIQDLNIPVPNIEMKAEDLEIIAQRAMKEGNPTYPVPKLMNQTQCQDFLKSL